MLFLLFFPAGFDAIGLSSSSSLLLRQVIRVLVSIIDVEYVSVIIYL